ncbi:restriction endonuclease [Bacillus alkalisoli]|uniref:restriction endonuclease n=1 Tax=Bacillus alkalisoli TaxID=2011008 RepID=UPI001D0CEE45|nr:restriction endonuclease [Bacillus alkalisoli]
MKHNLETKIKIGNHTKMLWESNSIAKQRMIMGLKRSGLSQKGKIKVVRTKRYCKRCNLEFVTLISSSKVYCGRNCSGKEAIRNATVAYVANRNHIHECIRILVIQWSITNKEIVLKTPYNKIRTSLKSLLDEIKIRYGVSDIRVICKAVLGVDTGRKDLIRFMKKISSENIC